MTHLFELPNCYPNTSHLTAIDSQTIACGCATGTIYLWNWHNYNNSKLYEGGTAANNLVALNFRVLASSHMSGKVFLWDLSTKQGYEQFKLEKGSTCVSLVPLTQGRLAIVYNSASTLAPGHIDIYQFPTIKP